MSTARRRNALLSAVTIRFLLLDAIMHNENIKKENAVFISAAR